MKKRSGWRWRSWSEDEDRVLRVLATVNPLPMGTHGALARSWERTVRSVRTRLTLIRENGAKQAAHASWTQDEEDTLQRLAKEYPERTPRDTYTYLAEDLGRSRQALATRMADIRRANRGMPRRTAEPLR